ncbi:MAG: hypothetical protein FWC10_09400, partial [Lentimicrobiaceae bacterium]|nr:hypothetical protein [Lentimicrobiaceae bacterium]
MFSLHKDTIFFNIWATTFRLRSMTGRPYGDIISQQDVARSLCHLADEFEQHTSPVGLVLLGFVQRF